MFQNIEIFELILEQLDQFKSIKNFRSFPLIHEKTVTYCFILCKWTLFDKSSCTSTNMLILIRHAMLVVYIKGVTFLID